MSSRTPVSLAAAALLLAACGSAPEPDQAETRKFEPTWESIRTHQVPEWYDDAKLGIFIHWGIYSVPAWAKPSGALHKVDSNVWFTENAYAEMYMNTWRIDGSPGQLHHFETYGKDFDYMDFTPMFNEAVAKWNPDEMARALAETNARYVVLTTKHHDGFTLWPSDVKNPNRPADQQHASRDIAGELAQAVRAQGMRLGYYYSGGLDWSFNLEPIVSVDQVAGTVIHDKAYAEYADAHWRELIARYKPDILWNDIGYPSTGDLEHILADCYNDFPDGVINNRFETGIEGDSPRHHDFVTPEYKQMDEITDYKWETCRGLGFSFGYNQIEGPEHTIGPDALIHLLTDIVSKNGNLLLNVGPMADGTIPEIQAERLRALGAWLDVNGEAIFETRPWDRAVGKTAEGIDVRFTAKHDALYAILLARPSGSEAVIEELTAPEGASVTLLGAEGELDHRAEGGGLAISLPADTAEAYAYAIKISPRP